MVGSLLDYEGKFFCKVSFILIGVEDFIEGGAVYRQIKFVQFFMCLCVVG